MRGASAAVIRPKFAEFAVVFGALKFTWFSALNSSPRSCSRMPSRPESAKNLDTAISVFETAEPLMALFGEAFRRGWLVLAILALSAIPTVMNTLLGAALLSNGRAWARAGCDVLLAVVFLGSAWFLVPRWQATGLALSFAVAYSTASLCLGILLRRPHAVR